MDVARTPHKHAPKLLSLSNVNPRSSREVIKQMPRKVPEMGPKKHGIFLITKNFVGRDILNSTKFMEVAPRVHVSKIEYNVQFSVIFRLKKWIFFVFNRF